MAAVEAANGRLDVYLIAAPDADVASTALPLIRDTAGEFAAAYSASGRSAYVLRPDGYLGFAAGAPDNDALVAHLRLTFKSSRSLTSPASVPAWRTRSGNNRPLSPARSLAETVAATIKHLEEGTDMAAETSSRVSNSILSTSSPGRRRTDHTEIADVKRRTADWTESDFNSFNSEGAELERRMVKLLRGGVAHNDATATSNSHKHSRRHRSGPPTCSPWIHVCPYTCGTR